MHEHILIQFTTGIQNVVTYIETGLWRLYMVNGLKPHRIFPLQKLVDLAEQVEVDIVEAVEHIGMADAIKKLQDEDLTNLRHLPPYINECDLTIHRQKMVNALTNFNDEVMYILSRHENRRYGTIEQMKKTIDNLV